MDALRVIHAAADELAQPPPAAAPPATEAAAALAAAGRSRRWASGARPRPGAAASVLGRVAPLFFFPRMARYDDPANTFQLLGEDCFLLQALLNALAALLRGAAAYPCATRMARALWELAWSLRHHPEAVARRGVLVALSAIAQALPAALLHDLDLALPE